MEAPPHFSFNRAHNTNRETSFRRSIQSHSNRETVVFFLDDLNASDGFAAFVTHFAMRAISLKHAARRLDNY